MKLIDGKNGQRAERREKLIIFIIWQLRIFIICTLPLSLAILDLVSLAFVRHEKELKIAGKLVLLKWLHKNNCATK